MKPRDYQAQIALEMDKAILEGHQRILVVAPTGAGKTVIFTLRAQQNYVKDVATLITVNRNELITQTNDKLVKNGVQSLSIMPGQHKIHPNCNVASIETLSRRLAKNKRPPVDELICDEIHIRQHDKIIREFPYARVFGFTGTPHRTGKGVLGDLFTKVIDIITPRMLVDQGWLVPNITYAAKEDFPEPEIDAKTGDYNERDMFQKMDKASLYAGVVDQYRKYANGASALCFNANVEHSLKMTRIFNENGISAKHIDGTTPKADRKRILEEHARGEFLILCNCSVFTTGFDGPYIRAVIMNRATTSLPLYLQMDGRDSRPNCNVDKYPDDPEARKREIANSPKPYSITLDHGGNAARFGLWAEDRDWSDSLEKTKKKKDTGGVAAIKECLNPECNALISASARVCPYCNTEAPVIIHNPVESEGFIEVKERVLPEHLKKPYSEMSIEELEERRVFGSNGQEWKQGWLKEQLKYQAKKRALDEIAEKKGVPNPTKYYRDSLFKYAVLKQYKNPEFWVGKNESPVVLDILGSADAEKLKQGSLDFFTS